MTARSIATGITITLINAVHAASTINAASARSTPTSSVYPAANTDCTAYMRTCSCTCLTSSSASPLSSTAIAISAAVAWAKS